MPCQCLSFDHLYSSCCCWWSLREKTWLRIIRFVKNKGADQPVHLRSLIRALVIWLLESIISKLVTSNKFAFTCSWAGRLEHDLVGNLEDWPWGYKTQLSTKFQLLIKTKIPTNWEVSCWCCIYMLINVKMPTIVGILTFMSRINFVLRRVVLEKSNITSGPGFLSSRPYI